MSKAKGKSKSKAKAKPKNVPAAPFYVAIPGGEVHPFTTETEVGAYVRSYLASGKGDGSYVVGKGDGTPVLEFDPFAAHLYSREEAVDELTHLRAKFTNLIGQVSDFRHTKNAKANQAIDAGLIPVDVLKGHIHHMAYEGQPGQQQWVLTLASFGPSVTDDQPLTRALVALTDHLGAEVPPSAPDVAVDETIGNPDDAAAVVTTLPDLP